jgi:Ca2+-binding EF-hand superfamily protein
MDKPSEEQQELREHFAFCDTDRDNRINYGEFLELLENLEAGMSGEELQVGFGLIDLDGNGYISFDEFQRWWSDAD